MTNCIKDNPGSIGYIDSGHGWAERLNEVAIRNKDNRYLTGALAVENQGLMAAIDANGQLPSRMYADWGNVLFINQVRYYFYSSIFEDLYSYLIDIKSF